MDLADAQGELRADCDVRKKGDIDFEVDLGAGKKKRDMRKSNFLKFFDLKKQQHFLRMKPCQGKCYL